MYTIIINQLELMIDKHIVPQKKLKSMKICDICTQLVRKKVKK